MTLDEVESKRSDAVHNEQAKLTATFLNGLAITTYAIGGFAPFVAAVTTGGDVSLGLLVLMLVCPAGAFGVHLVARLVLRGLK